MFFTKEDYMHANNQNLILLDKMRALHEGFMLALCAKLGTNIDDTPS